MRKSARGIVLAAAMLMTVSLAQAATLRIGLQDDADTLDPIQSTAFITVNILESLCDKLIDLDQAGNYIPMLAQSWDWAPDSRSLTMKLRTDAVFQNGETFDAEAVRWNVLRSKDITKSRHAPEARPIADVVVVDPHTVRFELSQPYAPLLAVLSSWNGYMLAPKASAAAGADVGAHPICVGPYQFERHIAQDRVVVRRSGAYWNPAPRPFDEIDYITMPDPTLRLANLRAGQLDLVERVAPTDIRSITADPHLRLFKSPALGFRLMTLNVNRPPGATGSPLADARIREAFEDSIDRDTINQVVFGGEYTPDNQTAPPGSTYFAPDFPVPHRDLPRARQLLQEAGIPHPAFTMFLPNNPEDSQIGEVIQSMSAEAGFDVKLQTMEAITLYARADRGDFQAILNIWSGRPDPDQNLAVWMTCDASLNRGRYCNPALDQVLHDAGSTADEAERVRLYRAAAAIYLKDRPFLFLYHYTWFWAATTRLDGFSTYADGLIRPLGISLKP